MFLYFFKKKNKELYTFLDEPIDKRAVDFILPDKKGLNKVRCKSKDIIDFYEIDSYNDMAMIKQELKDKYGFRVLLIKAELEECDLYKLNLMLLGNIFFDVVLKQVDRELRTETEEPQIWEVFNKESALEGMVNFGLQNDIPDDVRELMYE